MRGDSEQPEAKQLSSSTSTTRAISTASASSSGRLEKLVIFPDSTPEALASMPAGDSIESEVFELGGHPWQILLYPGGVDRVSIYVRVC